MAPLAIGPISDRPAESAGTAPGRNRSSRRAQDETDQDDQGHRREREKTRGSVDVGPEPSTQDHPSKVPPLTASG
jgi:hypothetical protein